MKKQIFFTIIAAALSITVVNAQGGGGRFQRRTVEERVAHVHSFLDSAFDKKVGADRMTILDSTFASYFRAQDKMREEMMAASGGGRPDEATMDAMRTKMQELAIERDEKLQKALSPDQYKKWKDELEAALNPRRGPRGG